MIGTPVDEHLNPDPQAVPSAVEALAPHLRPGQLLVLRSTVYPGVTALVERRIAGLGLELDVSFCPERIAEGKALTRAVRAPPDRFGPQPRARWRERASCSRCWPTRRSSCSPKKPNWPSSSPTPTGT